MTDHALDHALGRYRAASDEPIRRSPGVSKLLKRAVYKEYASWTDRRGLTWVSDRKMAASLGCTPAEVGAARAALIGDGLIEPTSEVPEAAWGRGKAWRLSRFAPMADGVTDCVVTETTRRRVYSSTYERTVTRGAA